MRSRVYVVISLAAILTPVQVWANCDGVDKNSPPSAFASCLQFLNEELENLEAGSSQAEHDHDTNYAEVTHTHEGMGEHSHEFPEIPSGIVVASWKRCESLGSGWSDFHQAGGRMIVGAGNPVNDPFRKGLTRRESWTPRMQDPTEATVGGAEEVTLSKAQMPKHRHSGRVGKEGYKAGMNNSYTYHNGQYELIGETGGSQPHPNMPPYIALYFCKKD